MNALPAASGLGRFLEIDLLRGVGVLLMVAYHALFDLNFFFGSTFELNSGIFWAIGRGAAVVFVGLAGMSMVLAWKRKHAQRANPIRMRGLQIMGLGLVITAFTWIFFPAYTIWFGVLHGIGASLIIGSFLVEKTEMTMVVGILITIVGILFSMPPLQSQLPLIVPLFPVAQVSFDYFPLLPWLGVFLLGMSGAHYFYPSGRQRHKIGFDAKNPVVNALVWTGRKSLAIYFVHQPVLVGIMMLARMGQ